MAAAPTEHRGDELEGGRVATGRARDRSAGDRDRDDAPDREEAEARDGEADRRARRHPEADARPPGAEDDRERRERCQHDDRLGERPGDPRRTERVARRGGIERLDARERPDGRERGRRHHRRPGPRDRRRTADRDGHATGEQERGRSGEPRERHRREDEEDGRGGAGDRGGMEAAGAGHARSVPTGWWCVRSTRGPQTRRRQQNARRNFRPDPVSVDASTVRLRLQFSCPFGQDEPYGTGRGRHNGVIHEFASSQPPASILSTPRPRTGASMPRFTANRSRTPIARAATPRRRRAAATPSSSVRNGWPPAIRHVSAVRSVRPRPAPS